MLTTYKKKGGLIFKLLAFISFIYILIFFLYFWHYLILLSLFILIVIIFVHQFFFLFSLFFCWVGFFGVKVELLVVGWLLGAVYEPTSMVQTLHLHAQVIFCRYGSMLTQVPKAFHYSSQIAYVPLAYHA